MPLNFEQAAIQQPKIDIIGKEVPLKALEKTGDVLQERYDKSYEDFNKFQELSAQTEQIADEDERQKVKDMWAAQQGQIKQIQEQGDFHNMRWQTQALANRASNNLAVFGKRAETIGKIKEAIANAENIKDPRARKYYEDMLREEVAKTTYDAGTNKFDFKSINTPKLVGDFDFADALLKSGAGWEADTNGFTNGNIQVLQKPIYNKDGSLAKAPGVYDITSGKEVSEVKYKEVLDNIQKIVMAAPGARESLQRDVDIFMKDNPNADPKKAYEAVYQQKVRDVAEGVAEKNAHKSIKTVYDEKYGSETAQNNFGFGPKPNDNQGIFDQFESTIVPGETSPLVNSIDFENLTKNSTRGSDGMMTPNADMAGKLKLVFSGLSIPDLKRMQNGSPEEQKMYKELNEANVYSIYNKVMDGKSLDPFEYNKVTKILKDNNYAPPSSYKWVSTNDKRLLAELVKTDPSVMSASGIVNAKEAQNALNRRLFGNDAGLVVGKNGSYVGGNTEGLDVLDPETMKVVPFKESGLLEGGLLDASETLQANGKVLPGSLPFANSENPQQDLSYFGNGYTVNKNGKQYIVAKRGRESLNSNGAKLNDLASFSRYSRKPQHYTDSEGKKKITVSSDYSGNVRVEIDGKKLPPIPQDVFNSSIQMVGNSGANPFDFIEAFGTPTK